MYIRQIRRKFQMSIIMPTIIGYRIVSPDGKKVISEHGPDELKKCRELIQCKKWLPGTERGPGNVLEYIFKEIEPDADIN